MQLLQAWGFEELVPLPALHLLSRMLCVDPALRCTLVEAMAHPWVGILGPAAAILAHASTGALDEIQDSPSPTPSCESRDEEAVTPSSCKRKSQTVESDEDAVDTCAKGTSNCEQGLPFKKCQQEALSSVDPSSAQSPFRFIGGDTFVQTNGQSCVLC
jgi:serine/threonine protein kinase